MSTVRKHLWEIKGPKGTGKTTSSLKIGLGYLACARAARLVDEDARVKLWDTDGHGDQVLAQMPLVARQVDYHRINGLRDLERELDKYNAEKFPVVIVDSASRLEEFAIKLSNALVKSQRSLETFTSNSPLPVREIATIKPSHDQKQASRRLQYTTLDAISELPTHYTILTTWRVERKQGDSYEKSIPFTKFTCDGVFATGKRPANDGFSYYLFIEDLKAGKPGVYVDDPNFDKLVELYPVLDPAKYERSQEDKGHRRRSVDE
jgi:hypothetical protein